VKSSAQKVKSSEQCGGGIDKMENMVLYMEITNIIVDLLLVCTCNCIYTYMQMYLFIVYATHI